MSERGGKEKGGKRGGEGGEGRGVEAFLVMWPRRLSALNPPLTEGTGKMRVAKLRVGILRVEVRAKRASI